MVQYHEIIRLNQIREMLNQRHVDKLLQVKSSSTKEIEMLKNDIYRLQNRLSLIKETPMGLRNRSKELKPLSCMVKRGGAYKKWVFGVNSILDPSCTYIVDLYKTVLKKNGIKSMLKQIEFDALRKEVVNLFIANLTIDVKDVQGVCDDRGINREAYASLFKVLREGMLNVRIKKM
jgi:hypothetical protein